MLMAWMLMLLLGFSGPVDSLRSKRDGSRTHRQAPAPSAQILDGGSPQPPPPK